MMAGGQNWFHLWSSVRVDGKTVGRCEEHCSNGEVGDGPHFDELGGCVYEGAVSCWGCCDDETAVEKNDKASFISIFIQRSAPVVTSCIL